MCRLFVYSMLVGMTVGSAASAVESKVVGLRFRLVGIINASDRKGNDASLAVIRDEQSGRSMMVRKGESLPGSDGVTLAAIKRSEIELLASGQVYTVGYSGTETKEDQREFSPEFLNTEDLDAFYYERRVSADGSTEAAPDFLPSDSVGSALFDRGMVREDGMTSRSASEIIKYEGTQRTVESSPTTIASPNTDEPRIESSPSGGMYNEYSPDLSEDETRDEVDSDVSEMVGVIED